jgi:hypothetical protein
MLKITLDFDNLSIFALSENGRIWQVSFTDGKNIQTLDLTDEELMAVVICSNDRGKIMDGFKTYNGYDMDHLRKLIEPKMDMLYQYLCPIV